MSTKPINKNTQRKHQNAVDEYHRLSEKKKKIGERMVRLYSKELCIAQAAYNHYLEPATLESILFRSSY